MNDNAYCQGTKTENAFIYNKKKLTFLSWNGYQLNFPFCFIVMSKNNFKHISAFLLREFYESVLQKVNWMAWAKQNSKVEIFFYISISATDWFFFVRIKGWIYISTTQERSWRYSLKKNSFVRYKDLMHYSFDTWKIEREYKDNIKILTWIREK